jgi:uncharacterized protein YacL
LSSILRVLASLLIGAISFALRPFDLPAPVAAAAGVALSIPFWLFAKPLRLASGSQVSGLMLGMVLGLIGAALSAFVLATALPESNTRSFLVLADGVLLAGLGSMTGFLKGDHWVFPSRNSTPVPSDETSAPKHLNLLDTSVIIDGRIADIAETGFLDGTLAIPQFVLRELQLVADSADSLKRNRGRRGLDVLQRLQKMPQVEVRIVEDDIPQIRDVDMKLVQLGKLLNAKVVTNDFNLNKVAQLHGVEILNINELANALKPIVLPGETMRVFVLKEGKEYNQGVAYLDDGTMVVVDNARKMISKTIDISVTSVLQTTAGKMIFGRFDERSHAVHDKVQPPERTKDSQPQSAGATPTTASRPV